MILRFRDETQKIRRLRRRRHRCFGGTRLPLGGVGMTIVKQRHREIEMCRRERRLDRERLAERGRRGAVIELLEPRDPEIARAVRPLEPIASSGVRRRDLPGRGRRLGDNRCAQGQHERARCGEPER